MKEFFDLNDFVKMKDKNSLINKYVEVLSLDEYAELNYEKGMIARVVEIIEHDMNLGNEGYYEIVLDFSEHLDHNIACMPNIFYNHSLPNYEQGPFLKWHESAHWRKGQDSVYAYVELSENNVANSFCILENELFFEYTNKDKETKELSYIKFLENKIKELSNK